MVFRKKTQGVNISESYFEGQLSEKSKPKADPNTCDLVHSGCRACYKL